MPPALIGQILTLLIMVWGFSIMIGKPIGRSREGHRSHARAGSGLFGRLLSGLVFSALLPMVWWAIALIGRLYHRTFIVFTEFITGVHDWGTYRTSSLKYGGAIFALLGFNGALFLFLSVLATASAGPAVSFWVIAATISATAGCCVLARLLMRRMP